jgi:hypothetical protein
MFRSEAHFTNYGKWINNFMRSNDNSQTKYRESLEKDTCSLVQVSLMEVIKDPSYFIRRISSRIITLNQGRDQLITNMTVYFDLNKTILTIDDVKGYGRKEIILLETYKNDNMFLKWAYGFMHEGERDSLYYQDWVNDFKKSINEPKLIELAAKYSRFDESNISGVGDDNVVSSFWECLSWMDQGGDNSDIRFNIVFRTFGTDLSSMFEKIEAAGFGHLISTKDSYPFKLQTIHLIPSNYLEPSKIQELISENHIIVDRHGRYWLQSGNPVPGPKDKDTVDYSRITMALERAASVSLETDNHPEPYLYLDYHSKPLTSIDLSKCVPISNFNDYLVKHNYNKGMIKSMIGIQDNYKPWSRKNWKAGKPVSVIGHSIVFDDYNYVKKEENMGTYITALYKDGKLVEGSKSQMMERYPML